jgi:O-antigen ligase
MEKTRIPFGALFCALLIFYVTLTQCFFISQSSLLLIGLIVLLAGQLLAGYQKTLFIPANYIVLFVSALWGWQAIALSFSAASTPALYEFIKISFLPLGFWIMLLAGNARQFWIIVFSCAVIAALFCALLGSAQIFYQSQATAFFINRNSLAAFLNLTALPLAAYYLYQKTQRKTGLNILLALALFILFYGSALTFSRGALIGFVVGLIILVASTYRHISKRSLFILLGLLFVAYLLPNIFSNQLIGKLAINRFSSSTPRAVIWHAAWTMWQHMPWHGAGNAGFLLFFPQYAAPQDISTLQYAHNDYFQTLLSFGYPGLMLLIGALLATAYAFIRFLFSRKRATLSTKKHILMSGLFAGLLAVAIHSFVTYNFYVPAISLLFGLYLGYFTQQSHPNKQWQVNLHRFINPWPFRIIICSIAAIFIFYASLLKISDQYYQQGVLNLMINRIKIADHKLTIAANVRNNSNISLAQGVIYSMLLPELKKHQKKYNAMYTLTEKQFEKTLALNPRNGLASFYLATLWAKHKPQQAKKAFQRAITLTPRSNVIRLGFAKFLIAQHQQKPALALLERGMNYPLHPTKSTMTYLSFLQKQLLKNKRYADAKKVQAKIKWLHHRP